MEKYQGDRTKIKHKCICGEIFEARPNNILSGSKCGCQHKNNWTRDFYKDKKTLLYLLKIKGLYKIGITTQKLNRRYSDEVIFKKADILLEHYFDDGAEAWDIEHNLKLQNIKSLYKGKQIFEYTKNTEIFTKNIIKDIYEEINNFSRF